MKILLWFCLLHLAVQQASGQNELVEVEYKVIFNQRFDQDGEDLRSFTGFLRVHNALVTDFYMVSTQQIVSSEKAIEIRQDTVWRVRTDLEKQELFFDDVFNEKPSGFW